jgi:ribosomal protein S20
MVKKGVIHRGNAARRISRLALDVNGLKAKPA